MSRRYFLALILFIYAFGINAQFNIDRLVTIGRNSLFYEDYVLSIQYFNQAINSKPYLYEPWFLRAVAKYYLDDVSGAEQDCTEAIKRNPFHANVYELRGLARIRQNKYAEAINDYTTSIKYDPDNFSLWHNRVLCRLQMDSCSEALKDLDTIEYKWPKDARPHEIRSKIHLQNKDTLAAINALNKSLELDPYNGSSWASKGMISLSRQEWAEAESLFNKAIHYNHQQADFYINRALARVNTNNLRGAMDDYDMAIDLSPNNFLGHYNRGLLRAQVGDDNKAIEDFDFVINIEPNNLLAIFNRAILREKTGNFKGAVEDYSVIIEEYPNFWTGLLGRASCYRKLGLNKKAEIDEFAVYKARLYKNLYGQNPNTNKNQTRKRSDNKIEKYAQLVISDEQEIEQKYESAYRGKVQNHSFDIALLPMFRLSFEKNTNTIRPYTLYYKAVESFNEKENCKLYITNETKLTEESKTEAYFKLTDSLTRQLASLAGGDRPSLLIKRAVVYTMLHNYENAIDDLTLCQKVDSTLSFAYWQNAVCLYESNDLARPTQEESKIQKLKVLSLIDKAILYDPANPYLYYNRGNIHFAQKDYDKAIDNFTKSISIDPNLAEAYYNRGLSLIYKGEIEKGIKDLSKAGESGIYSAYYIIRKYGSKPTAGNKGQQ